MALSTGVTLTNLLHHCKFTRALWDLAISCLGKSWVASDSIKKPSFSLGGLLWKEGEEEEGSVGSTSCHFLEYLEREKSKSF